MASSNRNNNAGYDVVVDVDEEGDLGHTDLQEDLEFHNSTYTTNPSKPSPGLPPPATSSSSTGGKAHLFSLNYYSQFFDVDTASVLQRCGAAIYPRQNFLDVLDGNPDLYGPFWIATTVVFILFVGGTVSGYLADEGHEGGYRYDFGLLSGAAGLIYGYTFLIPTLLWLALKYFSATPILLEQMALYGYANLIWIPVALISWSQINLLNWIFVGIGFGLSVSFLLRNLYPVLSATEKQTSKIMLIVVIALHLGLAVTIKWLFFAHGSKIKPGAGAGGSDGETQPAQPGTAPSMMFF